MGGNRRTEDTEKGSQGGEGVTGLLTFWSTRGRRGGTRTGADGFDTKITLGMSEQVRKRLVVKEGMRHGRQRQRLFRGQQGAQLNIRLHVHVQAVPGELVTGGSEAWEGEARAQKKTRPQRVAGGNGPLLLYDVHAYRRLASENSSCAWPCAYLCK